MVNSSDMAGKLVRGSNRNLTFEFEADYLLSVLTVRTTLRRVLG